MVSTTTLNEILFQIKDFLLDAKTIARMSKINLLETQRALDVLTSHGYVLKSHSKGTNEGKKYHFIYYTASESAKEILSSGGFTKQLTMKEKNQKVKNIFKNVGQVAQNSTITNQSSFENINTNIAPKQAEKIQNTNTSNGTKHHKAIIVGIIVTVISGVILLAIEYNWFK